MPLDKMAAPDPLAPLEPEVSLVSWDSPDLRVLLVRLASPVREECRDLLAQLVLLAKMVMLVLLVPPAPLDLLEREVSRDLVVLPDSRDSQDLRVPLVSLARLESKVCPVRLVLLDPLDPEVTEDSPVSAVPLELLALLDPVVLLDLLVTMVLRVMLVPQVLLVHRDPQDCRECPVSVVLLASQDLREREASKVPRELMVPLVRMVSVV